MNNVHEPYSEFGYYIHQIVALIDKRGDRLFRNSLGISLTQFMLLRLIEASAKTQPSQQVIAKKLGIAKSAMSRHVVIAEERGWLEVRTSSNSKRQNTLILTRAGKKLLERAKKLIEEYDALGFDDMPAADVEVTMRTLKSFYDKLQATQ